MTAEQNLQATLDEPWFMPTKDELDNSEYESAPLSPDDYIAKIAKITIGLEPTRNAGSSKFDYSKLELQYKMICLPYKLKAEDGLLDTQGRKVKPLTQWLWRSVNPFSLGFNKQNEPSFLRAVIMYCNGQTDPNAPLKMPGVIVLTPDNKFANDEEAKQYKEQFTQVREGKIAPDAFGMRNKGYKHIPDIRGFEGKYIGVRIALDDKQRNKITGFSKVPTGFIADESIEIEAAPKFNAAYEKMINKRKENSSNQQVSETTKASSPVLDEMIESGDIDF